MNDNEREALAGLIANIPTAPLMRVGGDAAHAIADVVLAAGFRHSEERSASEPSDAICPSCRGEVTSWFCDSCGNTGKIKIQEQEGIGCLMCSQAETTEHSRECHFDEHEGCDNLGEGSDTARCRCLCHDTYGAQA